VQWRGNTYRTGLHHLLQREIHPRVARNQVSVERLAILELHQHRVALCSREQAEWELRGNKISTLYILHKRTALKDRKRRTITAAVEGAADLRGLVVVLVLPDQAEA
jgi:hypothetical protein